LFTNASCDPSGFGEGERPIATLTVGTDGTGFAPFMMVWLNPFGPGQFITATATDAEGNTSEFSACLQVRPLSTQRMAAGQQLASSLGIPELNPRAGTAEALLLAAPSGPGPSATIPLSPAAAPASGGLVLSLPRRPLARAREVADRLFGGEESSFWGNPLDG
jgi:hypothetical protein